MISAELSKKLAILPTDNLLVINPLNHSAIIPQNSSENTAPTWISLIVTSIDELTNLAIEHKEIMMNARVVWIYYPKKTGQIKSDLSRDVCWKVLVPIGFTPNSQISIDDTWSALRFKPTQDTSIWVEKYLDHSSGRTKPRERVPLEIPHELQVHFEAHPNAKEFFTTLSYSCQREYVQYVAEAKKTETRVNRAQKTLEALLNHKKSRN